MIEDKIDSYLNQWDQKEKSDAEYEAYSLGYIDALKQVIENAEALIECAEADITIKSSSK